MTGRIVTILVSVGLAGALLAIVTPAVADVIHLKNGGTITADSWELSGDQLLIRQGTSRITVPRSQVERIEPSAPAADAPAPAAPKGTPAPAGLSDESIQNSIDTLKRRIDDYPLTRA